MELQLIDPAGVKPIWPLAEEHIKRAVEQSEGLVTLESHRSAVFEGRRQLWLMLNENECCAAFVTEVINNVFFIWAVGGNRMKNWLPVAKKVFEGWAQEHGCKGVQLWGRPGWSRVLDPLGYRQTLVCMTKEF